MKIFKDADADLSVLKGKTIAILGYGIQGSAQAQNWRDSGLNVIVGAADWDKQTIERAKQDGMNVMGLSEASAQADVICLLTPDMVQKKVYEEHVAKSMKPGKTLYFSHGLNIVYKFIVPPKEVDVIMVAPKSPGKRVRETFLEGFGTPVLVSVYQDASGNAKKTALALAKGLGALRAGAFEATFEQETQSDLFGEQAVLCGGVTELIKAGFDTLTQDGFAPEVAYFEVLHELKLIMDLIQEGGLEHMWQGVSETARYGGRTRGPRIIGKETREAMKQVLKEVRDGSFAKEWLKEYEAGMPLFKKMKEEQSKLPIETIGKEIRETFFKGKKEAKC
ncbi:ketol-acid reductoisomerase [Candidatus Micrarchaeota archaeon]|nr:ketol-acid reductoisomerase [Candidatus Micrarchaeota archaeon]